jgi:hypothetical protein
MAKAGFIESNPHPRVTDVKPFLNNTVASIKSLNLVEAAIMLIERGKNLLKLHQRIQQHKEDQPIYI